MSQFTTFNQFDKRFDDFEKFGSDRTACPLFGIITCYNFMQNGDISQKQHENNIYASVTNYMTHDVPKYMSFDELLFFSTNLNSSFQVIGTTPELIVSGILGYENMFQLDADQQYCVLFLKNRNYIPILCKYIKETNQHIYAVRDCHENTQKTFNDFNDLRKFLDQTYQFEQMTVVDGVIIEEFSNIEFIVINSPFMIKNIDPDLFDQTINDVEPQQPEPIYNIDFDHQIALSLYNEMNEGEYVNFV
jgi:hypothetical protein